MTSVGWRKGWGDNQEVRDDGKRLKAKRADCMQQREKRCAQGKKGRGRLNKRETDRGDSTSAVCVCVCVRLCWEHAGIRCCVSVCRSLSLFSLLFPSHSLLSLSLRYPSCPAETRTPVPLMTCPSWQHLGSSFDLTDKRCQMTKSLVRPVSQKFKKYFVLFWLLETSMYKAEEVVPLQKNFLSIPATSGFWLACPSMPIIPPMPPSPPELPPPLNIDII